MIFLKKAQVNQALVRNGYGGTHVRFDKIIVFPLIHQFTTVDLSLRSLSLNLSQNKAVWCKDFIKADIKSVFYLRIPANENAVKQVMHKFDVSRFSDMNYLNAYFLPRFDEAVRIVAQCLYFRELYERREDFIDQILNVIGNDLNGFSLDDMSIDFVEQTSLELYDPENYLEQRGKAKIEQLIMEGQTNEKGQETEETAIISRLDLDALEAQQKLETEVVEAKIQQKLEIARLEAEQEVLLAGSAENKLPEKDALDEALEKVRAQAREEKEKREQLQQKGDRLRAAREVNDENENKS